jgi:hypothetical protein
VRPPAWQLLAVRLMMNHLAPMFFTAELITTLTAILLLLCELRVLLLQLQAARLTV